MNTVNTLDSRFLQYGDTFTQAFPRKGKIAYSLGAGASRIRALASGVAARTIEVTEPAAAADPVKGRKSKHHVLRVSRQARSFAVDPAQLKVEAGDSVMWAGRSSQDQGFSVSGSGDSHFDSAAMTEGSVYSHPFGVAGEYEWEDANGSGLKGKVIVRQPQLEGPSGIEEYRKLLAKGTLVLIQDRRVEPETVEIVVGQTVFFAVEKAAGITITDRRLLGHAQLPAKA